MKMLPGDYDYIMQRRLHFDRMAFEAWILEGGTLEKAYGILEKHGIVNKRTGRPYTQMGIYQAAHRYIANNHQEVRPILENLWKEHGVDKVPDDVWEKYILKISMNSLLRSSKGRFLNWLEKYPEFTKYEYMYADEIGLNVDREVKKYE